MITPRPTSGVILTNPVPAPFNPVAMLKKMLTATLGKVLSKKLHKIVNDKIGSAKLRNMLHKAICTHTGHPVDVATGNFFTDEEDFFLPGPVPLSWERTYYSKSDYKGPLGNGWHHAYDMAMHLDNETNTVTIRLADGRPIAFEKPTLKKPSFNKAEQLELFLDDTDRLYLSDIKENLYYYFTPTTYNELHLLQTVADANGFAISFSYDTNGFLTKITDAAHRELTVANDGQGRILSITAPHPTLYHEFFIIAAYAYDATGNLIKQTNAEANSMLFEYQGRLMTKETWRNGLNWFFEYDGTEPGARCIHTWGDGDIYNHKLLFEAGKTIVTDSRGHDITYYHKNGLVYKRLDPNGALYQWHYDQDNQLLSETDPLENTCLYCMATTPVATRYKAPILWAVPKLLNIAFCTRTCPA
jgi:YD repeat-containing protein